MSCQVIDIPAAEARLFDTADRSFKLSYTDGVHKAHKMRWLIFLGGILVSVGAAAQETIDFDPTKLLLSVRKKVIATIDRLPNYLCTESIERSSFLPEVQVTNPFERNAQVTGVSCRYLKKLRNEPAWKVRRIDSDNLRVDVVFSKEGEMYSPVGQNRFPDRNLADLVENGVTSTGAFGAFLSGIFSSDSANFTYHGETVFEGRRLAEFHFQIPLAKGGYAVKNVLKNKTVYGTIGSRTYSAMVPYEGMFLVDPKTFNLVRLTVTAEPLPEQLKVCEITSTLDYSIGQRGTSELLLPTHTRLHVVNDDGSESENNTSFSGCHEFVGQSVLLFGGVTDYHPAVKEQASTPPLASATRPDRTELLQNVRNKILATIDRLPRYVCTETVDRSVFSSRAENGNRSCEALTASAEKLNQGRVPNQQDRLRLDVAVSSESEMYSWVGENRFRNRSLVDLVGGGAISTGAFGTFLSGIFVGSAASFTAGKDVNFDGRALVEFGFQIAREKSRYSVGDRASTTTVPYEGAFFVDPKTFDLVRLVIHANQLPEQLRTCGITTTLDYHNVELKNFTFLLPSNARFKVIGSDGSESDNSTAFSGCHEFHSESTLSFNVPASTLPLNSEAPVLKPAALPAGLHFVIALLEPITPQSAAGEAFTARLTSDIRQKNAILIPKGATISGRIVRLTRVHGPASQSLTLALRPETIESNGTIRQFPARFATMVKGLPDTPVHPGGSMVLDLGSFDQMAEHEDPRVSLLRFANVTADYVIHRGLKFEGVTLSDH